MLVSEIVDSFLEWSRRHGRSENSLKSYRGRLKSLVAILGDKEFSSLTPLMIDEYLYKANEGKKPNTQRLNIISFERLHNWALENRLIDEPILLKKLEKPAAERRDRYATEEENQTILDAAAPDFKLVYASLRQCGARPGELAGLQIEEINFEKNIILIEKHKTARKTKKPRKIAVGKKLEALLKEAIADRVSGNAYLRSNGEPWTSNTMSKTFSRIRDKMKLPKDLVLYMARHEHATKLCNLVGIHAAKDALGHTDIKTTQRYLHTTDEELQANQDLVD